MPEFKYDKKKKGDQKVDVEKKSNVILEDGGKYEGEWNKETNQRHGRGRLVYSFGSVYEGHWGEDKFNGRGRMIHSNGDIYDGNWKAD